MASHNNNWRHPSAADREKYSLNPLPDSFEPTVEEQQLLDLYEAVRGHERQAQRWREEEARRKLAARDAAFQQRKQQQQQQQRGAPAGKKKKKHKRQRQEEATGAYDDLDDVSSDDSDIEGEEEEEEETLHDRREAKLAELREQVEEAKQQAAADQADADALREQHLAETAALDDGLTLRRKRLDAAAPPAASSLIQNMTAAVTPPHDFSKRLELTAAQGSVLFPTESSASFQWTPPEGATGPNDGALTLELPGFDVARAERGLGKNTIGVKFQPPPDSKRFSLNIALPDHDDFSSVLFHFNPRQFERGGQLVLNSKLEGTWDQAVNVPLSQVPLMFGQSACTLRIQITGEGFDVFVEDRHCARLEHRQELPSGPTKLVLQFPSTDDYGSPERWTVYKVWWGNKPLIAKGDVSGVPGVNNYNSLHPRKLFVSGLSKIFTESEVDVRRAELERAFRPYGGDRGVEVIVPTNATYAFVEVESERHADLALQEMAEQYNMNRARRSRHDALQEERAAAEAARLGGGDATQMESSTWD